MTGSDLTTITTLALGLGVWNDLAALDTALEVRRAIYELTDEQLRALALAQVANSKQEQLSPEDYSAWWGDD